LPTIFLLTFRRINAYIVGKFDTEVYYMPTIINIYTLKINSISSNASVNIGESFHNTLPLMSQNGNIDVGAALQNSHTSNNKLVGVNFSVGDLSPAFSNMISGYFIPILVTKLRPFRSSSEPDLNPF
jgi:hypothetical protein